MGLKDWAAKAPVATYGEFILRKDGIEHLEGFSKERRGLDGVTALVESGEALSSRVTLTRLVAIGVFAFAAKKKKGGTSYLLIEGPDFAWTMEVKRGDQAKAQAFAAKVRAAAKVAA